MKSFFGCSVISMGAGDSLSRSEGMDVLHIVERVRTGTPACWASNNESPLAVLECGLYDGRGAALYARRRWWLE